jgi:hypothetical protein
MLFVKVFLNVFFLPCGFQKETFVKKTVEDVRLQLAACREPHRNVEGIIQSAVDGAGLMPARHCVSSPTQILRQIRFHLSCRLEWHRVEVLVQFWQEADAVSFDYGCCLDAGFVLGEVFCRGQPRHPHVNAGLLWIAIWIVSPDLSDLADCRGKQYDVNVVMQF